MSILNKVLIGLIFFASVGMFLLGARALKTHQYWRDQARSLEQQLAQERDLKLVLIEGPDAPEVAARQQEVESIGGDAGKGIQDAKQFLEGLQGEAKRGLRAAQLALAEQLTDRGRVWFGCRPAPNPVTATTGQVKVTVDFPDPHHIAPQTVLWVFDEAPVEQGGRYLGQFTVANATGKDLELKPAKQMIPSELAKLDASTKRESAAWTLYELMPADNHQTLAGLTPEQLKAALPPETVEEYLMDGQLTTLADVKQRGLSGKVYQIDANGQVVMADGLPVEVRAENEKGKYLRQLRDYEVLFGDFHVAWTRAIDRINTLQRNNNYLAQVTAEAGQHVQFRQNERDQLAAELKKQMAQRDMVVAHLEAVKRALATMETRVAESIKTVQALAGELARIQQEATRLIDERTRAMAQAGLGE